MSDEFVEVIDLSVVTIVPGVTLQHTIRKHEGDVLASDEQDLRIQFGEREVVVGNETRKLRGRLVTIPRAIAVEVTSQTRWEQKVRPSLRFAADREKAEVEALKDKLGLRYTKP